MLRSHSILPLIALAAALLQPVTADNITLDYVIINISLTETATEQLLTANVTMKIGNGALVGGAAVVDPDMIHFTFPFAMTLDNRFGTPANFQAPITLQDILNNVLATTNPGPHANGLDGGDVISYAANGGTPIGAFSSDPGTDDDNIETETDSWVTTVTRQIGQNRFLIQSYQTNYSVVSPAERGTPTNETPEPSSWIFSSLGLLGMGLARTLARHH